jgi:GMP synthase (glutamine-hydrolysing)
MMGAVIRIGLLRMTEFPDATKRLHGTYADVFERFFSKHRVEIVDVPVHEGAAPTSLADCDGWVISGSPQSTFEDHDWIRTGEQIIRAAAAEEHPMVGICFGHQLIAQALGGRVERSPRGWGIGAQRYETVRALPQFAPADSTTMLASHQDQVVELPADGVLWSTSEYCPNAGFTVGERILTMQAHPEFTPHFVTTLYNNRRDRMGEDAVEHALTTLATPLSNDAIADGIVAMFAGLAVS